LECRISIQRPQIEPLPFCILPPTTPSSSNVFSQKKPRRPLPSSPPSVPSHPAQTRTKIPCPLGLRPGSAPPPPRSPVDAPSNRRRRRAPRSASATPLLFAPRPPTVRGSARRSYSLRTAPGDERRGRACKGAGQQAGRAGLRRGGGRPAHTGGGRAGAPATKISGTLSAYSLVLTVVVLTVVYVLQLSDNANV
jgi:hypothetical protein